MKRRIIAFTLLLALVLAVAGACTPPVEVADITVTDMMGRTIVISNPVERVVALSAADCEILYALGAGDMLVGRGEYCNYPDEVLEITAVQSGAETNIEQIIALEPDVLFMSSMAQSEEQVAQLETAGIAVVVSDADTIDGVYEAIELIGDVCGKSDEADALAGELKAGFAELAASTQASGATVYFEVSPLQYGLWTAGTNTFMDEIAAMVGVTNCFADVTGWGEISEEQVLERNPDYIVTISMYFGEGPTPIEEICARAGWADVTAVKNGAILNLQNDELSRPGPRLLDGAKALYQLIYGDAE
ncbi:MAG: ABC transporter substrate-binding protein [Clostridia bacterium]|nr:ABC transporter substrate-binding protein [Clostridia bacterium]